MIRTKLDKYFNIRAGDKIEILSHESNHEPMVGIQIVFDVIENGFFLSVSALNPKWYLWEENIAWKKIHDD